MDRSGGVVADVPSTSGAGAGSLGAGSGSLGGEREIRAKVENCKVKINTWETDFAKAHGRKPTGDEVRADKQVYAMYREYRVLKADLEKENAAQTRGGAKPSAPESRVPTTSAPPLRDVGSNAPRPSARRPAADSSDDEDDDDGEDSVEPREDPFGALLDALDDLDVTQMFHEVDTDGSQSITHEELSEAIRSFTGLSFNELDIAAIVQHIDADSDGSIDMLEFVQAIEQHDGLVEPVVKPPKTFPTPMQKSMMSKRWNDVFWPLIHASFGLLLVLLLVNGLIGPVNGEGGNVALEMTDAHVDNFGPSYYDGTTGETYLEGDIYPCAPSVQEGKCRNSLTPLSGTSDGDGGLKSMPKAFYPDAYLGLGVSIIGLLVSLTMHYVIVPGWRKRMKTMKQLEQDHEEASSESGDDDAAAHRAAMLAKLRALRT